MKLSVNKATPTASILCCLLLLFACSPDVPETDEQSYILEIPRGFPPLPIPTDNPFTESKIALGKKLFFDPILSVDSTISCSSCHATELAFADNVVISPGVEGRLGFRNSPTLANIAYAPYMLMDGGVPAIEQQIYVPLEDYHEMDFNMVLLIKRLQANSEYSNLFYQVFQKVPDAFGITRALSAYERTLISGNSLFDKYFYQNNSSALDDSQIRGMQLFFSDDLNCSKCHSEFNFTNYSFENNGLYEDYGADSGRARITHNAIDADKFKVPTLRNVELTAPFMHDGSIATLQDVIEHYNSGGANHPNKNPLIKPLELSSEQKSDLLHFLMSLTDNDFTHQNE
ncbi:MAG: cytochrome-c peroxidase [Bacteroidetes bacterium]|nr:cytochrome-c peroxidase [Bacteroidota bacterium]MBP7399531.1 hypothetical protein [Chitinophagales bacterium]MBK7107996.1 cytochrome-c peroxidase [Bacteroidota bacterium]MBK8486571.1 cytochrome-c peroxidase [Bacteroidota bacterium]MBK8683352.1 cytochrome-c peroxidase [Bacteroidota bacterium]